MHCVEVGPREKMLRIETARDICRAGRRRLVCVALHNQAAEEKIVNKEELREEPRWALLSLQLLFLAPLLSVLAQ